MSGGSDDCIQFTRHAGDVLFNFNQLRSRNILTDVTILVGGREFHAHKTVLMACSGFFYSIFINAQQTDLKVVSLDAKADPDGFDILLEFMYTSCLTLKECYVVGTLNTAVYLQMEHMVETCRRYMECRGLNVKPSEEEPASFPHLFHGKPINLRTRAPPVLHYAVSTSTSNPTRIYSRLNPLPGSISNAKALHNCRVTQGPGFSPSGTSSVPGTDHCTRASIVLQLDRGDRSSVKTEEGEVANFIQSHFVDPRSPLKSDCQPNSPAESSGCGREASSPKVHNWKKHKFIVLNENLSSKSTESTPLDVKRSEEKCELPTKDQTPLPICTQSVRDQSNASTSEMKSGEKPYRCSVCGAQFNRPANLKTHLRIHSGEKPYKCETCGSAFVQVAHLRAHVLIHTGEKPYSCSVCSTRFRHLQTLKSHMRIHTGEKPYQCDSCNLRFRHKSQLRLHLRQKHGWITNSKASKC